jgi:hypothetical protein
MFLRAHNVVAHEPDEHRTRGAFKSRVNKAATDWKIPVRTCHCSADKTRETKSGTRNKRMGAANSAQLGADEGEARQRASCPR